MTTQIRSSFYVTGGTLPRDAACYVPRQADTDLLEGLRQAEFCYVLHARQMGKSSLMVRTATRLRQEGVTCVILDLTAIGQNLDAERWYGGLLNQMGQQVDLEDELDDAWFAPSSVGPLQRWMKCLKEVVLKRMPGKLVIFVDEIDAVRSLPFSADELFAGIRECYNRRTEDPDFHRLAFCLLGVATPADLIRNSRTTPFNIGRRIELTDFTEEEAAPLAVGLSYLLDGEHIPLQMSESEALLKRVLYWTGGHPYLTQRLCSALAEQAPTSRRSSALADQLCSDLFLSSSARERDDNLLFVRERLLRSEVDIAGLLLLYRQVWDGKRVPLDETSPLISLLRLSGIARVTKGYLKPRNRIYAHIFDKRWIAASMPDAEAQRQRAAYRRGVQRTLAIAGAVILVMAGLIAYAFQQRNEAQLYASTANRNEAKERIARAEAERNLYVANMSIIQKEWNTGNVSHVRELLNQTEKYAQRGFEWGYWNRLAHLEALKLDGHTEVVTAVAFTPDGKQIATASYDGTAKLWNAETGTETRTFKETGRYNFGLHSYPITSVAFSSDGKYMITGSHDRTATVWDVRTGQATYALKGHTDTVSGAVFSADDKRILTGSYDHTVRLWNAKTRNPMLTIKGHGDVVTSVAISPDNLLIIAATCINDTTVWDAKTGRVKLTLKGHKGRIVAVAISADSKRILTGSEDNTARVWDAETGKEILTLKGHTGTVDAVAFFPDGKSIVTGSSDKTARVWDATIGNEMFAIRGNTNAVLSVAISPDGKRILTGGPTAKLWDAATGHETFTLRRHTSRITCVAVSPDGRRFVTGSEGNTGTLWVADTGQEILGLKGHARQVLSLAFSPDGKHIATGSKDNTVKVWDAETGREILTFKGHTSYVTSVAYSPDGRRIVSGSNDGTARVWDTQTGGGTRTLKGNGDLLYSVAFSADGERIVTASRDNSAKVWDTRTGKMMLELRGGFGEVYAAAFTPDGRRIVTTDMTNVAMIWDAKTGTELLTLNGHTGHIKALAISADGKRIVTGSEDKTARVWDAETGKEMLTLQGHTGEVNSVAFSPDSKRIYTGSEDHTVKIWISDMEPWRFVSQNPVPPQYARDANHHFSRAQKYDAAGRFSESIVEYKKALLGRPNTAEWLGNLGWVQYEAKQYDAAIKSSRSALEENASLGYVKLNIGLIYAVRNDWSRSKQEYELALKVADKPLLQAGAKDLRDALKKRPTPVLKKALDYLESAITLRR